MPSEASNLFIAEFTVSLNEWPPESSSSSRYPTARSPSGPGLTALMNMLAIPAGPDISIPGDLSSEGTASTAHSPVFISLRGKDRESIPFE